MSASTPDSISTYYRMLVLCLLISAAGCRPPADIPEILPATTVLSSLSASTNRLKDFKGSADVTAFINNRRGRVAARIRYLSPDRYRVDIQGGLFQVAAVLLLHHKRVQLYTPRENTVFEGTLDDREIVIPGLEIQLADLRAAAIGLSDLQPYLDNPISDYVYDPERTVITVIHQGLTRSIFVDVRKMIVLEERIKKADGRNITRFYEQYTRRKGIWRPGRIRIESDVSRESMTLEYNTQSFNIGLTNADMTVRLPASVIRRSLEDLVRSNE